MVFRSSLLRTVWLAVLACSAAQAQSDSDLANFSDGILTVPALRVGTEFYHLTAAVNGDAPEVQVQEVLARNASLSTQLTADYFDGQLSIPCLKAGDDYYHVTMQLLSTEPQIRFNQIAASPAPPCYRPHAGQLTFMSPHFNPILLDGDNVYVANTPAATVDVIDRVSRQLTSSIHVGVDPVSLALRPDGLELWVANHVSDSVSVIDTDPSSASFHQVIATVQDLDLNTGKTLFDEPVGIAFASSSKAYVALSSSDQIAVIDVAQRKVSKRLQIAAQDPRALAVRGNRLYVTAFESNNQSELSGCFGAIDGDQCTFSLKEHVVDNNNVLSLNYDADVVKDPRVPDRDLFVFDTTSDTLIETVSSLGTLLYGIAADSSGKVYIALTDARNTANGRAGTQKQTLADLQNRAFLNQIAVVHCQAGPCTRAPVMELEPLPPQQPLPGNAYATPFAIKVSPDDRTLVVTAAGSNKLFTVDAESGSILGAVKVQAVPRGIALRSNSAGAPLEAWVMNAVANSVSLVDLTDIAQPKLVETIALPDPTDPELKLGRAAFNDANASSTGTFSCESCHPDGHTDQLLWVLGGPRCSLPGCNQIPPRTTMPIRGLRDTAPYHWDGVPGDPFGLYNGQHPVGSVAANCSLDVPESCTRNLLDGALSSTMCDQQHCPENDEHKEGLLNAVTRDAMAKFLLSVPHPPARERPYNDNLTAAARNGFDDFFVKDSPPGSVSATCGSAGCHAMPFWTGTNIPGSGMDALSFRSLQDRWLLLPQGRVNMVELVGPVLGNKGFDEFTMWTQLISGSTADEWQMFVEGSMGYPGAFARQVTLNQQAGVAAGKAEFDALLDALELAASEESLLLQGEGVRLSNGSAEPVALHYQDGTYQFTDADERLTREQLLSAAASGSLLVTLTGRLPENVNYANPQPELWVPQSSLPNIKLAFPRLLTNSPIRLLGKYLGADPSLFVDGRRVNGSVKCESGTLPQCNTFVILIQLEQLPTSKGMHLLQVQSRHGLMSNEYLFFVL